MREVGWLTRDEISVRRNSIIKNHEGTWRIMNKQDRNEDVSKSRVHSAFSPTPKQKEAWRTMSPLNFKSHSVRYQCHVCLPACPHCHHREERKTCIFYQDISLSFTPVLHSASLSLLQTFVFYWPIVCRLLNERRHSRFRWNCSCQTRSLKGLECRRKRQKEQWLFHFRCYSNTAGPFGNGRITLSYNLNFRIDLRQTAYSSTSFHTFRIATHCKDTPLSQT